MESHTGIKIEEKIDKPEDIIHGCLEGQWKLINGFGGNKKLNKTKFKEAKTPNQFAISLTGESTIYPKLNELIKSLKKQGYNILWIGTGLFFIKK